MPIGTQQFEYTIGPEFFRNMENTDVRKADIKVVLSVKNSGESFGLDFDIKGMIIIPCDRCLDDLEHNVDTKYHLRVKYGEEYCDENDEVLIIPESDNSLNVAYMIYDSIILTIPLKHVHPMGKCNRAMSAHLKKHSTRNMSDEDFEDDGFSEEESEEIFEGNDDNNNEETSDPRWDALKDLKDNN